ncbi:BOP1NT domain-containing protein [Neocallimastix lanati (nom. inval.)]|nr:BOP1NT domain-containing protein [Neocallimastix sp. JGI-2020a]
MFLLMKKLIILNNNSNSEETFTTENGRETENTIGNILIEWYDDFPHIRYDINGKKIMRPVKGDELDKFLAKMEDPDDWKTVEDEKTKKKIVLSKEELDMIRKIQEGDFADGYDPYEVWIIPGKKKVEKQRFYALWDNNNEAEELPNDIPAPKLPLPENDMSYIPPAGYLPTQEGIEEWKKLDPKDRP